jgi:hypothetical protein
MRDHLRAACQDQALSCARMNAPFMTALLMNLPDAWITGGALDRACDAFSGDLTGTGAALFLRIAGGLHYLALTKADPALAAVYPPNGTERPEDTLRGALDRHDAFLADWIRRPPQTNEVGRSGVLIAAVRQLLSQHDLPLHLLELGASAGLNLLFDRYDFATGDQMPPVRPSNVLLQPRLTGILPPDRPIRIASRRGVDLTPLSPVTDADRLIAYVWPEHGTRLNRLRAALAIAVQDPPPVDRDSAADWLDAQLAGPAPKGAIRLVFHTIAAQYFPTAERTRINAIFDRAGATATPHAPLARIRMEAAGDGAGAEVTLQVWPGGQRQVLGRAGFHGEWLDWSA